MTTAAVVSIAASMEAIGRNLARIASAMERRLEIEHPPKQEPKDATITHIKRLDEEILADQGYEQTGLDRWLDIGTRESTFTKDS